MKRTLSLGNDYANSIGVVIDTMAAIDFDRKKGTEIVGSVIVSQSGIGTYFAPRQSKYKLVFRGKSPVFDEVGDSHNWYQRKEYVMPQAPVLMEIEPLVHVSREVGRNLVKLSWIAESEPYLYRVVAVHNDQEVVIANTITTKEATIPVEFSGNVLFYVYGVSRAGVEGRKSNKVGVVLPPVINNKHVIGDDVETEFVLVHNMDTFVVFARAFFVADGQEVLSGIEFSKPDKNTVKVSCTFVPDKDSIVVYLDEHGAIGNMHSQVYDTNNDGIVNVAEEALSLSEDSVLDGGDW